MRRTKIANRRLSWKIDHYLPLLAFGQGRSIASGAKKHTLYANDEAIALLGAAFAPPPIALLGAAFAPPPIALLGAAFGPPPIALLGAAFAPPPIDLLGAAFGPPPINSLLRNDLDLER